MTGRLNAINKSHKKDFFLPYGRQFIDDKDIHEVVGVLKSDWITQGPKVDEFEKDFAKYCGAKYAVAVSSGTAALHIACLASDLRQGDELITTPMTFVASANCALYCGAKPVFVDVTTQGLIDENKIKKEITKKTKIVLPVHYTGLPCYMETIKEIADENNLFVIEDACHALGAKYNKSRIGNCKYSDAAVFSFHPVKHITTGEGGMITTNSKEIYKKLKILRNHGITKNRDTFYNKNNEPWYHEMQFLGFNYRITDFQCALGIIQLKKLEKFVTKRRELAEIYNQKFERNKELETIKEEKDQFSSYHIYILKLKNNKKRLGLFNFLIENQIYCQIHYIPVYWHPYYQQLGYKKGICPNAEDFYHKIISIPIFVGLKKNQQSFVIDKILSYFP